MSKKSTGQGICASEKSVLNRIRNRENGYINTVEMLFLLTTMMCLCVATTGVMGTKVMSEFADLGNAIGSLNQSFTLTGTAVGHPNDAAHPTDVATWGGSAFADLQDFCDQSPTAGLRICIAPTVESP